MPGHGLVDKGRKTRHKLANRSSRRHLHSAICGHTLSLQDFFSSSNFRANGLWATSEAKLRRILGARSSPMTSFNQPTHYV